MNLSVAIFRYPKPINFCLYALLEQKQRGLSYLWDGKVRLSLSGVQDKLPLVVNETGYGIGEGDIAMYQDFSQEYAMAVGDEFNPTNLSAYAMALFCYNVDLLPRLFVQEGKRLSKKVIEKMDSVCVNVTCISEQEEHFIAALRENILTTSKNVMEMLDMVVAAYKTNLSDFKEISGSVQNSVSVSGNNKNV